MGPWGGFVTGLFENVEYCLTPAVIVTFISSYFSAIVGWERVAAGHLDRVLRDLSRAQHLRRRAQLQGDAHRHRGIARRAGDLLDQRLPPHRLLALGTQHRPDGAELPAGGGSWFPFGFNGILATLPFAVWLFLAIEQLPLAAEESVDPKRDMPRGILLGMGTLIISAFMIVLLNPSVAGVGAFKLGTSGEPLLDGFRAIFGNDGAVRSSSASWR
jgi:ethanolamine permease